MKNFKFYLASLILMPFSFLCSSEYIITQSTNFDRNIVVNFIKDKKIEYTVEKNLTEYILKNANEEVLARAGRTIKSWTLYDFNFFDGQNSPLGTSQIENKTSKKGSYLMWQNAEFFNNEEQLMYRASWIRGGFFENYCSFVDRKTNEFANFIFNTWSHQCTLKIDETYLQNSNNIDTKILFILAADLKTEKYPRW